MKVNYEAEKKEFIAELEAGEFDIATLTNEEADYQTVEEDDFLAFREHLNSDEAKTLSTKILNK